MYNALECALEPMYTDLQYPCKTLCKFKKIHHLGHRVLPLPVPTFFSVL